jgi:hypothetical protein
MSNYRVFPTPLSDAFFSPFNREYLHGAIVRNVKTKTSMTIDRQNDADLSSLMHSVYMHMMSDPDSKTQVAQMNDVVVREATKTIQTGILQQLSYFDSITRAPNPLSMPISTSTHGNKMSSNDKYGF